jgi:hypothetical protein
MNMICVKFPSKVRLQKLVALGTHDIYTGGVSSVGLATRYGLDGPWIESRWGRDFPHPSRSALGPTQPPIQRLPSLFSGVK